MDAILIKERWKDAKFTNENTRKTLSSIIKNCDYFFKERKVAYFRNILFAAAEVFQEDKTLLYELITPQKVLDKKKDFKPGKVIDFHDTKVKSEIKPAEIGTDECPTCGNKVTVTKKEVPFDSAQSFLDHFEGDVQQLLAYGQINGVKINPVQLGGGEVGIDKIKTADKLYKMLWK